MKISETPVVLWLIVSSALCACSTDATDPEPIAVPPMDAELNSSDVRVIETDAMVSRPVTGPTFWQDVVPILDRSCMGCHQAGGIAPMKFDTYRETKTWGAAIVAATQNRTMPPWLAKSDGSCGEFKDSEWLSDNELQTLQDWFDTDMAEGTPTERIEKPVDYLDSTHSFTTPNFFPVRQGTVFAQFDEYRCFAYTPEDLENNRYFTGYEVFPGNEAIVHHVIGVFVNPDANSRVDGMTNAEQMAALDDESPDRPGWPCFTGAGSGVRGQSDPIAWAPGQGAVRMPEGTGVRVPANAVLVLQVHYNLADPANEGTSDETVVNVQFKSEVDTPIRPLYVDYFLEDFRGNFLPRGEAAFEFRREDEMRGSRSGRPVKIWGILPHMHERGQQLTATLKRDEGWAQCMVQVDQWDFAWQRSYWYREPIVAQPDDLWEISCVYDTMDATANTLPGWGTRNEMCLTVLYVSEVTE